MLLGGQWDKRSGGTWFTDNTVTQREEREREGEEGLGEE